MAGFLEYLKTLKGNIAKLGPNTELVLICGNEACDLDSVASALAYAHYSSQLAASSPSTITIPLLQCRREELALKQDVKLVLDKLAIEVSELCSLDDLAPAALSLVGKLSLVLVDHNVPMGLVESYAPNVIKVIDHHQIAPDSVANKPGVTTILEMVGSCSSLVTGELLKADQYVLEEASAILLLSAVLLDTGNLKPTSRTTQADKHAVEELLKVLPDSFDCENHFKELLNARFDVSKLSIKQVLNRDYKEVRANRFTIGCTTITALLSEFLSTDNVNSEIMEFQSNHKLDVLIILGVTIADPSTVDFQRQIAVVEGTNSEMSESVVNMLESEESLKCERLDSTPKFCGTILKQGNTAKTRKHLFPLVISFITSVESESPKTDLSPSHVEVQKQSAPEAVFSAAYPLEPTVTILSSPLEPEDHPSPSLPPSRSKAPPIPEYTSTEECKERRARRYVNIGGEQISISMDMVQPYRKIIQHAGYVGDTRQALVVLSACYLPPKSLSNYNHVVHHLFYYILSVLDKLIVDDYTIVYLHSGVPRNSTPSIQLLHRFYKSVDRRLRKQLTQLFIVHPTFWVKTILRLSRPFISKKFWRKVHFIPTLQDLSKFTQLEEQYIPAAVTAKDKVIMSHRPTHQKYMTQSPDATGSGESGVEGRDSALSEQQGLAHNSSEQLQTEEASTPTTP